jgi:N-acetylmuramoyl-L-alanine amidase
LPSIIDYPSPNFEARRVSGPSLAVLHYTGMQSGEAALKRLCDPAAKVSAHYLVEEDGRVFRLVDEAMRAWHAGVSFWRGIDDINSHSIGIEIVNPGHEFGYRAFPAQQMQAVLELCRDIKGRHALAADAFLAHSDIAPLRKEDPGELLDWKMLSQSGIGLWPRTEVDEQKAMEIDEAHDLLERFGYAGSQSPADLKKTLIAFQRRYDQKNLSGELNGATPSRLRALVRLAGR